MKIKGIHIEYDPVKEPIRRFKVVLELTSEHPQSAVKLVLITRTLIMKAIWWLLLSLVGFGRPELDYKS